jgi:hypothetical protein
MKLIMGPLGALTELARRGRSFLSDRLGRRSGLGLVLLLTVVLAVVGARDRVGGWNDGSRLAMVECLVDYHTLAIDQSIYLLPFGPDTAHLVAEEVALPTRDRLFIAGHYYSDKTPVPGVLLAGMYEAWHMLTGQTARSWPEGFAWCLTLASSGLAYGVGVCFLAAMVGRLGLPRRDAVLLTASLAVATVAPIYAQYVNNHILLLAVGAGSLFAFVQLADALRNCRPVAGILVGLGTALGLGYTVDQGAGPMLLLAAVPLVLYRCRTVSRLAIVALAAAPWLLLHHALNYAVGGSWKPANAFPEYFNWPGCPFTAANMTGVVHHPDLTHLAIYTVKLMFAKRGFVGHDLVLLLVPAACIVIAYRRPKEWPEALFALAWCVGTVGLYAVLSSNGGGECRSVRWLVPLLVPAYFLIALLVREAPRWRYDVWLLTIWGTLQIVNYWPAGPWDMSVGPWYWPIQGAALVTWFGWTVNRLATIASESWAPSLPTMADDC